MAPMSNRLLVPRKVPGLLDLVPGAAAAYSLRSLSNSYADPVVTVRRSSDDAEEDFTASEVADGTLAAFCGAGDGFVYRWWDQSGNARHAVAAADANEPKIVGSGVVVTEEGKPAIQFDGVDDALLIATTSALSPWSVFEVKRRNAVGGIGLVLGKTSAGAGVYSAWEFSDNNTYFRNRAGYITVDSSFASQNIFSGFSASDDASALTLYRNGAIAASSSTSGATSTDFNAIGQINSTTFGAGTFQELVFYPSDLTAQRELVEGIIAWGYSV